MDDGLVLNLVSDDHLTATKSGGNKKGGRWTERLVYFVFPSQDNVEFTYRVKAKRSGKRKIKQVLVDHTAGDPHSTDDESDPRPSKRRRTTVPPANEHSAAKTRPSTQIISSLFSSNPQVDAPVPTNSPRTPAKPSNAPLVDSSTFTGLGLDPLITAHLSSKMNIAKPTSIQRAALSIMLAENSEETSSRDVFIQAQTGSGKTLSFLLPIIQDLLPLSTQSYIDRSIGSLAIIIAPTRELAKQISDVLEAMLNLRLRPQDEPPDEPEPASSRLTRWLVSGLLTGGATRTHEKARLRKGIPILVSTPGRLLDHLQNTSSFNAGKCRWLVLDEADRLMELGFEETITGIIQRLDGRRKLAMQAQEQGMNGQVGGWDWTRRRRTVLCSATIREDVQKLANAALVRPIMIKATIEKTPVSQHHDPEKLTQPLEPEEFTPPSQLSQKYIVVPLKLRLVTLVALLRSLVAKYQSNRGAKFLVFLSCTDSVDFHWRLIGNTSMEGDDDSSGSANESDSDLDEHISTIDAGAQVKTTSSLLPDTSIFRLHGSLPNAARLAALRGFSMPPSTDSKKSQSSPCSILLCTSLAARGLDLPMVRAVVQHDLPTEGGATEYVHRVGRTARVGKGGEAWSLVSPSEVQWVKWVEEKMLGAARDDDRSRNVALEGVAMETVLRSGFGGRGTEYEDRATEVQLAFEKWVLRQKQVFPRFIFAFNCGIDGLGHL